MSGVGTERVVQSLYRAFDFVSGDVSVENLVAATIEATTIDQATATAVSQAWLAVGVPVTPQSTSDWRRTVIFIYGDTTAGQDMFIRGGLDHQHANTTLGRNCQSSNLECAMPIQHRNFRNTTTAPWKHNDIHLDWHEVQDDQRPDAEGTALDWNSDHWPSNWGQIRQVSVDGYGVSPLNTFGMHNWMLDVDMDCSPSASGWFELKSFLSNGPGWENNIQQSGTPYSSGNHFAECGKSNVFIRNQNNPILITNLP